MAGGAKGKKEKTDKNESGSLKGRGGESISRGR